MLRYQNPPWLNGQQPNLALLPTLSITIIHLYLVLLPFPCATCFYLCVNPIIEARCINMHTHYVGARFSPPLVSQGKRHKMFLNRMKWWSPSAASRSKRSKAFRLPMLLEVLSQLGLLLLARVWWYGLSGVKSLPSVGSHSVQYRVTKLLYKMLQRT